MSRLSEEIASLTPEQRAVLERRLQTRPASPSAKPSISRRAGRDRYRLSFAQERIWFLEQLEPSGAAYNVPIAIRLDGALDAEALLRGVEEIVRRHEILRSRFASIDGEPWQSVRDAGERLVLPFVDLEEIPEPLRRGECRRLADEDAFRPFRLAEESPFRSAVIRLGRDEHLLLATMHHIASDALSVGVFLHELSVLYRAFSAFEPSPLAELPVQYGDYAEWQRETLDSDRVGQLLDYWKRKLGGELPVLELPSDRPRRGLRSERGPRCSLSTIAIPKETADGLRDLGRLQGATLFMTLLAALDVLLYRLTGETDVIVGAPSANRSHRETEGLIGFFLNTLVLRTDLSGEPSFLEILHRARETALEAFSHQDLPFERLISELNPKRRLAESPLFQVFFNMLNLGDAKIDLPGLKLSADGQREKLAKFDLTLYAAESRGGIALTASFDPELFDDAAVDRMLEKYRLLLERVASAPESSIDDLDLLTESEKRALPDPRRSLEAAVYPSVPRSFRSVVERAPRTVAVRQGGEALTYSDLRDRADALGLSLAEAGVSQGEVVAVSAPPSFGLVSAALGTLANGFVLLTLDRRLPKLRQLLLLDEARASRVVYVGERREEDAFLWEGPSRPPIEIPLDGDLGPKGKERVGPLEIQGEDPAYVFFTSGTTGIPKGVLGTHKGLAHFLSWQRERFGVGPLDRIPKLTSLAFDAVLRDLFLPLTSGATLCLPEDESAPLDRLLSWMQSEEVTLLHTVPTFAGALLSERPPEVDLPSLRAVFFSGEPLTSALVNRWREAFGARSDLVNFYGPTETTMIKCFHVVPGEAPDGVQPTGSPLPATQALVLGPRLGRRGVGEVGEIAIRTPFRTRGYLNQPEETARAFVPNPHSGESGDLLYLTGDLGRHRSDGSIDILGRRDAQVKIRGARVELPEIEAACARHGGSSIVECAAVMSDSGGEPRLSLYLVPRTGRSEKTIDIDELKKSLSQTLPEYMVPSAFVVLDSLPRTPSGKLDRKELPEPDWSVARSRYRAPRTPTEEELLSLWAELLSIANPERVSVDEDFFDLGGHSLLATRLVSRIRRQFRVEIPVRRVFETPTLSGLSRAIDELLRSGEPSSLPPAIEPAPEGERNRLSFSQRRMWFFDQMVPGSPAYNIPVALRIRGPLAEEALSRALRAVVSRHEGLRTTFEAAGGEPRARLGPGGDTALDVEAVTEDLLGAAVRAEIHRPFDLSQGPLLRAKLLRLSDLDRVLVVTMHHIVSDAWSIALFLEELSEHYRAALEGREAAVERLPVQYADFAYWQHRWLSAESLRDDLEYWKRKLAPPLPVLDLPTDRPRPKVQSFEGARLPFRLSGEATSGLKRLARSEGATLYSVLLAAFGVLLHRRTGDEDVLIGSPVASRHREELERLIGLFVNSVVLRIDLSGEPSFRELLERVRRTTLEAYAHQDLPFERLVEELEPDRDLGRNPLFQVMLVMHTTPRAKPSLEGAAIEPMPLVPERSRFDLTLSLFEAAGEIGGVMEYSSDLFEPSTIERMLGHYARLLEGIAESPGARIAALPLLGEEERAQVLSAWNRTTVDHDLERTVLDLFEEQVARNPEALAAAAEGVSVSYGELDRRAGRLAGSLVKLGVGLESPVAVSLDRSPDLLVAILAVMKTGGAYVAMDPDSPAERIGFMLRDSRARAWIAVPRIAEAVDSGSLPVMSIEGMAPAKDERGGREALIERRPTPENLAYVIYTSGSTGAPKAVAVPHRGLSNLAAWHRRVYEIGPRDRATQIAGLGFDASVWEVWPYLTAGASVHFAGEETRLSPSALVDWIARERITVSFLPTPLAEAALSEGMPADLALRALLTGGDKLHLRPEAGLSFPLVNHYGPTETTVVATATEVAPSEGSSDAESSPPIGRPIDNFHAYVLDPAFAPLAIGVEGELLIGGAGVARGYLGRPDLTAERFVPDPFSGRSGARLYRTGDLARFREDGQIEFLGRRDHQVKIRGFRVELGEIESVLLQHEGVQEAAVILREDSRLAGCIVGEASNPASAEGLRAHLQARLPDYMAPSTWVFLDAFPLTPSGKVDRRALLDAAEASVSAAGAGAGFRAPRSPVEEALVEIWSEVLKVPALGIGDNFFEVGGHSLLATRVVSRIREAFGCELPLRSLFERPTIEALASEVESLTALASPLVPPLRPVSREGDLPLSFAQQRLWFLAQLEPDESAYHIAIRLRLLGKLDVSALERSLEEIVRRHEALRTVFPSRHGKPVQKFLPPEPFVLGRVSLADIEPSGREAEARSRAASEIARPFEIATGPLVRALLIDLDERDHGLVLTLHHIVADGWSMGVLLNELSTLYGAFSQGLASPLPELPIQYADFASWQRSVFTDSVLDEEIGYWKGALAGEPRVLDLPADFPRPPAPSFAGDRILLELPRSIVDSVRDLSRREGATLFMTLLAGFQTLLHRYTGEEDVIVGTPIANRRRSEVEGLIGFFVNTLVMRAEVSPSTSFRHLLRKVRDFALGAYAHQDVPFEKLVEELKPQRDLSRNPFFQVLFALQNQPPPALGLSGIELRRLDGEGVSTRFDLEMHVWERPSGLTLAATYRKDLFARETISRLLDHYRAILASVGLDPETSLARIPLLSEEERSQLLVEMNRTRAPIEENDSIAAIFDAGARSSPDRVAVEHEGSSLTYRDLDSRASRLARRLASLGAGPEVAVAVSLERSIEMAVAVLAILKTGAAYVPLDPSYPEERLRFMIEDSEAPIVVSSKKVRMPRPAGVEVVFADEDFPSGGDSVDLPSNRGGGESPAYVIFTSGSTGRPKGVAMRERALVNLLRWQLSRLEGVPRRTLQFAPLSFDVSFQEIFSTWGSSGTLVLVSDEVRRDPVELLSYLERHGVERLFLPFVALQQLVETAASRRVSLPALREVITAGEQLRITPSLRAFFASHPSSRLENQYGPTESHVATAFPLEGPVSEWAQMSPIGRPIANDETYVLDSELEPVPRGAAGEIYLGGDGLARGYHRRPEPTAERFLPDPFSGRPGARLYRTGDLGRILRDGNLQYLGRADSQVKLRGFRVEPGEIEQVLAEHPKVRDTAVVMREGARATGSLVAYVVPSNPEYAPSAAELRESLKGRLPEYMVPSLFVVLEELPLTPSGKLDRRSLPEPARDPLEGEDLETSPRSPLEDGILEIWRDVLGIPSAGIHEDFFDCGGHSLLATQVVSRIRETFGVEIPLRALFEGPTIAGLARAVERQRARGEDAESLPIAPAPRAPEAPLSFAQQRLWFVEQVQKGASGYRISAAMRLRGPLDVAALERAIEEILRRHHSLRTTFVKKGTEAVAVVAPLGSVVLSIDDVRDEGAALALATEERGRPFDLERGPLFRCRLLRLAEEDHGLVVAMHHIVSDGWSLSILLRDLSQLYRAFSKNRPSPLEPLPLQYADYAYWQRERLKGETLEAQLAYWRKTLAGAPSLALPTDHPRPKLGSFRGGRRARTLSSDLALRLRELSRAEGATLFMTLLAGLGALLSRYTALEDIVVGTPIANRNRAEVEGIVGFFVNSLPLRCDLSGNPTFREALARVRERALDAYAHQEVPFEKLVSELNPGRDPSKNPIFQVMFAVQNQPAGRLDLPGLTVEPLRAIGGGREETTRFDLELHVSGASSLSITAVYARDLFDGETIERLLRHYETLLDGATTRPDLAIAAIALLDEKEREDLLSRGRGASTPYARESSIHSVFEERAAAAPGAVAVVHGSKQVSYSDLNRRANRIAHHLRSRGLSIDSVAGLLLDRSESMIAGALGILKAGCAYLPLDPESPRERLSFQLSDSGAALVLTDRPDRVPEGFEAVVLGGSEFPDRCDRDPEPLGGGESLAYVMYTSGSTGMPKGVEVPHRAVLRLALGADYVHLGSEETILQLAPTSFDASTFEIWGALLLGGRVAVYPDKHVSPAGLAGAIANDGVTTLWLTASLFNTLVGESVSSLAGVRQLLTGGEALSVPHVSRAIAALPGVQLVNGYGPTESTTFACCYRIPRSLPSTTSSIPIGGPIAHTRIYVLDGSLEPVPAGVAGELFIGGDGIARGYQKRPELTAERFVPDPFADSRGARMYRTGDLVRYLPDGPLDFLGRADDQVKVRGYRIEPSEIESVLLRHENVREALVLAREDEGGDKRLVAYVVGAGSAEKLRAYLEEKLPAFMIPSAFVPLDSFPLNENGKIDRRRLPAPSPALGGDGGRRFIAPASDLEKVIAGVWREALSVENVSIHDNFFDLGGHSLLLLRVHGRLRQALAGIEVGILELFQYPTIHALAAHLASSSPRGAAKLLASSPRRTDAEDVAVIAMAGRFPGAKDLEGFWQNLERGVESIRFLSDGELSAIGLDPKALDPERYVRAAGILEDVDLFDAAFFNVSPREAESMDPQHRLFLETAWEALERAGYDPSRYAGKIGVYAGAGSNRYGAGTGFGAGKDFLPTRVSYKLNLRGPSLNVQTACSTSLVAVHLACQAIRHGDCDMALAGGVSVRVPQAGYVYHEDGIVSPDGHCRAFDASARGTVPASGLGIVLLKRLSEALRDGDPIHAIIKATAINNDGSVKVGYTAPGIEGQVEVIRAAIERSGIDPKSITYVESHGTGTPLGDPVEVKALSTVFEGAPARSIAMASLKSNLGHLDAAAGVAGLIKTALALKHRKLPPSLHFEKANPEIDFEKSPFFVNRELAEWRSEAGPLRAGVSSFGIGGTNAHAVLEEAPPVEPSDPAEAWQLLTLSARSEEALDAATRELARHLEKESGLNLADVAYTLQVGRKAFEHRRVAVVKNREQAIEALRSASPRVVSSKAPAGERPLFFLFPGQGAQHVGMGQELYRREPLFREEVDRCADLLHLPLGLDLRDCLYPEADRAEEAAARLRETDLTQPAVFTVSYALAKLWMDWGARPSGMLGHSIGEYVAACLAGVFSLEDALALVAARGRLMRSAPEGAMLSIPLPPEGLELLLEPSLSIAATNAPRSTVVAGSFADIERLESKLASDGIESVRLHVSHAFHSAMMEPILEPFALELRKVSFAEPRIPFVSNRTGNWIRFEEATSPEYWVRHLRETVRFGEGLRTLVKETEAVLLEVGPGRSLAGLARLHNGVAFSSLPAPRSGGDERESLLSAAGRLWLAGSVLEFPRLHEGRRRLRAVLPTYPFERKRFWLAPVDAREKRPRRILDEARPIEDWFYVPGWKQRPLPFEARASADEAPWLLFSFDLGLGKAVARKIRSEKRKGIEVVPGKAYRPGRDRFAIRPDVPEDYLRLLADLHERGISFRRVLHLGGSFESLLLFGRAIAALAGKEVPSVEITVVTRGAHDVLGDEDLHPEAATLLGHVKVMPQEIPGVACRNVDLAAAAVRRRKGIEASDVEAIYREALSPGGEDLVVALRNRRRWVSSFEPLRLPAVEGRPALLREGGVYLVTGGLGRIGRRVASYLAKTVSAKLVLTSHSAASHPELPPELDDLGELAIVEADVTDAESMRRAVETAVARFGALHGVIHAAGAKKVPGPIATTSPEECERQFAPRLRALPVLDEAIRDLDLDFVLVTSSLASVLGVTGFAAYTGAHAFLDAFVQKKNRESRFPWIAVDWDNWGGDSETSLPRGLASSLMSPSDALDALGRILATGRAGRFVVSTGDLEARIERWLVRPARAARRPAEVATAASGEAGDVAAAESDVEKKLVKIWKDLLGVETLGVHDNFFELGGDSVVGIQLVARARAEGLRLRAREVFEHPTISELARTLGGEEKSPRGADAPEAIEGPIPLLPIQRWFFEQDVVDRHHFNQAMMTEPSEPLHREALNRAWKALFEHHDGLRMRATAQGGEWQLDAVPALGRADVDWIELPDAGEEVIVSSRARDLQKSFDLSRPPLGRLAYFDRGRERPGVLFIVFHHLVMDAVSIRIVLEDLTTAYRQAVSGEPIRLPEKTASVARWARLLVEEARTSEVSAELSYWSSLPWSDVASLPRDSREGVNLVSSVETLESSLDDVSTEALLQSLPRAHGASAHEALLAALALSLSEWTGSSAASIDVEGHGRESESLDLSRTVGWFTSLYPAVLAVERSRETLETLQRVRDQLRAIPRSGLGYGLLRYLSKDGNVRRSMRDLPESEVSFLYLGRFDAVSEERFLRPSRFPTGAMRSSESLRRHLLEVTALVGDARLRVRWSFSRDVHRRSTIEGVAQSFLGKLQELAEAARPETFPGARLGKAELSKFLSSIDRSKRLTKR